MTSRSGQMVGDTSNIEQVGPGDDPTQRQTVCVAGGEPDGDLFHCGRDSEAVASLAIGAQNVMLVGDDAVGLAEMLVVRPEQVTLVPRGSDSNEWSARIASSRSASIAVLPSIREGGCHQHVGPAVLQGVGDLDVGSLLPWRGDQAQCDPTRLNEYPVQLGRLVNPRGFDVDPGELQVAKLRVRIECRELAALAGRGVPGLTRQPPTSRTVMFALATPPGVCDD